MTVRASTFAMLMAAMLVVAIALAATLLGAVRRGHDAGLPDPVALTGEAQDYFLQMYVLEQNGPKAQVHLEGSSDPLFFAQVRDAVAFLKGDEREARVLVAYVSDMGRAPSWSKPGADNWTFADSAFYVVGADVRGGLGGPEIVPFATRADAETFAGIHGGRITLLDEIPAEFVLAPIDPNQVLEIPS